MQKQLTWESLAQKTLEELRKYDKEHHTYLAYYFNDEEEAIKILAECIDRANKSLMWVPIVKAVD